MRKIVKNKDLLKEAVQENASSLEVVKNPFYQKTSKAQFKQETKLKD